jgi:hypothetical protein
MGADSDEVGHSSDVKAATHSEAKAATIPT